MSACLIGYAIDILFLRDNPKGIVFVDVFHFKDIIHTGFWGRSLVQAL